MPVPPRLAKVIGGAKLAGPVRIASEQALNPDSRVALGPDRDPLGLRRATLDWRLSELDVHTMRTAVQALGTHLAEQGIGRVRFRDWLLAEPVAFPGTDSDIVGGMHHMGTTRMADDPRRGVVDRDCRVHGLDNLFVGGSSVFGTPGHANPTYTIVQLALRLGDHLAERLQA
jgi:choline dehydrogenase-like flavoprotein